MSKRSTGHHDDPVLSFFGLSRFPFHCRILKEPYDNLFLNYTAELIKLKGAIRRGTNCAIVGAQGSGKSSFLYKLYRQRPFPGSIVEFALMSDSDSNRKDFLCEVLRHLLELLFDTLEGNPDLKRNSDVDIQLEAQRLGYTVYEETSGRQRRQTVAGIGAEVGGNVGRMLAPFLKLIAKVSPKIERTRETVKDTKVGKQYPVHTESTLTYTIHRICESMRDRIVLYVDELDKAKRAPLEVNELDVELIRILEWSSGLLAHANLTFVFTLQEEMIPRLQAAIASGGEVSLLGIIGSHVELKPVDESFVEEYVTNALSLSGWTQPLTEFMAPSFCRLITNLSAGNPRRWAYFLEQTIAQCACNRRCPIHANNLWDTVVIRDAFAELYGLKADHFDALSAIAEDADGLPEDTKWARACRHLVHEKLVSQRRGRFRFRHDIQAG